MCAKDRPHNKRRGYVELICATEFLTRFTSNRRPSSLRGRTPRRFELCSQHFAEILFNGVANTTRMSRRSLVSALVTAMQAVEILKIPS